MGNAKHLGRNMVILTEAETTRVRLYVAKVGLVGVAMKRLGLGLSTFNAARGYGDMQTTTRERVLEALDREEKAA